MSINKLEASTTVVLSCDFQSAVAARFGDMISPAVAKAASVIAAARAANVRVMHVVVGFRPGYPEIDPAHPTFGPVVKSGAMIITTPGADILPAVAPVGDEPIVVKRRVGAFTYTDLELLLRARKLETVVLVGVATSGVILSTVRYGSDAGFRFVVVADGCADPDEEVHRVLTTKVFPRQAAVATASEVAAALS